MSSILSLLNENTKKVGRYFFIKSGTADLFLNLFSIFIRICRHLVASTVVGRDVLFRSYPKNNLIVWSSQNESYLLNTSDMVIAKSVFSDNKPFEADKIAVALKYLPHNHSRDLFFDVGANIGTIGIHCLRNGYFKKCVGFEPEPNNFHLLTSNIALNGLNGLYEPHNVALSDGSQDYLQFELSKSNYGDHRIHLSDDPGKYKEAEREVIKVKCDSLDSFSEPLTPTSSVIWMDTQGAEGLVLAGAKKVTDQAIPLIMEFWPYGLQRAGGLDLLLDVLEASQYQRIIDLDNPDIQREMSRKALMKIAETLGHDGRFTDLLLL